MSSQSTSAGLRARSAASLSSPLLGGRAGRRDDFASPSRTSPRSGTSSISSSRRSSLTSLSSLSSRSTNRVDRLRVRSIPRAANWGWGFLPFCGKVMLLGVFSGLVALTTPHWAYIKTDFVSSFSTFGLWHYCSPDSCSSIHDNLVLGRSVPMWYHMTQGSLCIGVACSIIGLAMITNSIEGNLFKMTVTVHRTAASVLAISTLEHVVAMYMFVSNLDDTDFLYERPSQTGQTVDFYGSFYMGLISTACSFIAALAVYLDDSIYHREKENKTTEAARAKQMSQLYQQHRGAASDYGYTDNGVWYPPPSYSPPPGYQLPPGYSIEYDYYPPGYYAPADYLRPHGYYPGEQENNPNYPGAPEDSYNYPPGYYTDYPPYMEEEEDGYEDGREPGSYGVEDYIAQPWSEAAGMGAEYMSQGCERTGEPLPPIVEQPS